MHRPAESRVSRSFERARLKHGGKSKYTFQFKHWFINTFTMPSYNELQRRDSWPPTIVHLRSSNNDADPDVIDDNPFAFFLTSPDELDDFFDDEELDAGIETPESSKSPVREVSPSSLQRAPLTLDEQDKEENYDFGLAMPLSLKDFSAKHTSVRKKREEQRKAEELALGLGILFPEHASLAMAATRGRGKIRLVPTRGARGRGQTRSLSARRTQSWREPSPEIFSIKEEKESHDDTKVEGTEPISASAPTTSKIGVGGLRASSPVPIPKPKKRVHWAF